MKKIQKLQYLSCREERYSWSVLEWCYEHKAWESASDSVSLYYAKTNLISNIIAYQKSYYNNLPSAWIKSIRIASLSDFRWQYGGSLLASCAYGAITHEQSSLIYNNIEEQLKNNIIDWEQEPVQLKQEVIKIMHRAERSIGL